VGVFVSQAVVAYAQTAAPTAQPLKAAQPSSVTQTPPIVRDLGAPESTRATFGDWELRCNTAVMDGGKLGVRTCEVGQSIILQGQTARFAELAFGKLKSSDPLYFTAVVPTNISLPSVPKIFANEKDQTGVEIAWARCLPAGCFANFIPSEDILTRWRAQNDFGRLAFRNGSNQEFSVPISFKGLSRALDALGKENGP